jgi:hypothetical protein
MSNTPREPTSDDLDPADYADLAALARTLSVSDTHLDSPPDDLWPGIERLVAAGERAAAPDRSGTTGVTDLRDRARARDRRRLAVLGAAAAIVVALIGMVAFIGRDDGPSGTRIDEVALTNKGLDLAGAGSRASATLVRTTDGSYVLDIDARDLPAVSDGFLELWIIDSTVTGMYSLGPLHGSGRYVLPQHVEPTAFPIIDVSIEPTDGAPAHSGKSILRGQLTT